MVTLKREKNEEEENEIIISHLVSNDRPSQYIKNLYPNDWPVFTGQLLNKQHGGDWIQTGADPSLERSSNAQGTESQ